uniref:glycosyltransferase family 2 protein n=1 Tax=uncultured Tenacibaculum sp. TaxID=174713 RepID=UPI00263A14E2|nr:glycosyltransferase family 2 protein [uncultured Tenacibaculum sp.]
MAIKVSINCITYNHEDYIEDCLKGFLAQKTNFDFEVLIHDDASTDNTQEIIKRYEKEYPKIIKPIYQVENQYSKGKIVSFDFNFPRAQGKYLAMCEGDDYWTDVNKLQKQVDFLENNEDYSMCIHNAMKVSLFNGVKEPFNKNMVSQTIYPKDVILKSWFSPTASFLFRNNKLFKNTPKWEGANGDMILLFINATLGKIYYSNEIMSVYNLGTPSSLTKIRIKQPKLMFNKKMKLFYHFDKFTKGKYLPYTVFIRGKLVLGLLLRALKIRK